MLLVLGKTLQSLRFVLFTVITAVFISHITMGGLISGRKTVCFSKSYRQQSSHQFSFSGAEKTLDELAIIFENSLDKAVNHAVKAMNSPREDLHDALINIARFDGKLLYSEEEIAKLEFHVIKIGRVLRELEKENKSNANKVFQMMISEREDLSVVRARVMNTLVSPVDVFDLKEMVLFIIFQSKDPLSDIAEILRNKTLFVHNKAGTFENLRKLFLLKDKSLEMTDKKLEDFMLEPRWKMWASNYVFDTGWQSELMRSLGMGGTLQGLSVETKASNIIYGNNLLQKRFVFEAS